MNKLLSFSLLLLLNSSCSGQASKKGEEIKNQNTENKMEKLEIELENQELTIDTATFGAGCFWCVEAVFQQLEGVISVESGYAGGHIKNPSYKEVCNGITGHAEVAQIVYNPQIISYSDLLEVFLVSHDPTTLNKQGNDVGTQYRSAIFYHSPYQQKVAERAIELANSSRLWNSPIVTQVEAINGNYYKAELNHQDYYKQNKNQPYCTYVITPKVDKVRTLFKEKLKSNSDE